MFALSVCGEGTVVHAKDWGWSVCLQSQNWKPCTAAKQTLRVYYGPRFRWRTSGREVCSRTGTGRSSKQDFFTTRTLFIHRASAQTLIPTLEADLFPAFQRHSSLRTPTVHLNFSTWVFWCVWYLQGQNLWLCLSSIIHLSYEEQDDCDLQKQTKRERSPLLFQLPEKTPSSWTRVDIRRERECSLWPVTGINLSPLIIPPRTHKSQSTKKWVHSSHKAWHAPRREAQLKEETRETNHMGAISLMNRTLFTSYSS